MAATLSFVPIRLDWELYAGDYRVARFRFINQTTGGPQDMSGQHYAQIRYSPVDTVIRGNFQFDLTEVTQGIVMVIIQPEMTQGLVAYGGAYMKQFSGQWDWQWDKPGNTYPLTLYRGKVLVHTDISRASTTVPPVQFSTNGMQVVSVRG